MTWCGCPDAPRVMHALHVTRETTGAWRVVSYVPVGARYEHLPWSKNYKTKAEAERYLALLVLRLDP